MWYGAQIAEAIRDYGLDYGFTSEQTRFDFATLRKNREAYIDRSRNSYDGSFKRNGVERIEGRARFVDAHTVEVNGETIKAKHIVIATGAHPFIPSVPGAEFSETSDDVFAWEELPHICCHYWSWLHRSGTSRCAPPFRESKQTSSSEKIGSLT